MNRISPIGTLVPKLCAAAAALVFIGATQAQIVISEVNPSGSGNSTYKADWFELTNKGAAAVNISGWAMDDNSNSFGSSVLLRGITSIAAGQSVVFIEGDATGSTDASIDTVFKSAWFGSSIPAGLVVANYGGSGVGLSNTADAVNIFTGSGALVTRVDFGAATSNRTFDNTAGQNNVTISQLSTVGVNGAFTSVSGAEIGSPGVVLSVPEPTGYAFALVGMVTLSVASRRWKK